MADASNYLAFTFRVNPLQPGCEILIAELGEAGFESFEETAEGVRAYIQKKDYSDACLGEVGILQSPAFNIQYETREIETENWNAIWESNFNPMVVKGQCAVRASFHDKIDVPFEILIDPKMSFGTGHHETTTLMIELILEMELNRLRVLDMGCGTGVLSILAEMKGGRNILAIDIDPWSYENCIENVRNNGCEHIQVLQGDSGLLEGETFDVILANINRNVLLNDIGTYTKALNPGGKLLLSGFYENDLGLIEKACKSQMLKPMKKIELNRWVAVKFIN
ncbi:MAG: 50S ribosomal protein L11 methyltransferase [Bacteroidia bacterium]|nr:50S ribosomal protein L11 methyltransferase [Bacteroidia bacterium]